MRRTPLCASMEVKTKRILVTSTRFIEVPVTG